MAQQSPEAGWSSGVKLALTLSGWLVGPLVVALVAGKWLDTTYGTAPWLFLGSTAIAFVITCAGIVFETKRFLSDISQKNEPKISNDQRPDDKRGQRNKINDRTNDNQP